MSYSCVDAWDDVMDALGVEIPQEHWDSPSDQAEIVLAEIRSRQNKLLALTAVLQTIREMVANKSTSQDRAAALAWIDEQARVALLLASS